MALTVKTLVRELEGEYGVAEWWPRESSFEVAVGAILTQRTSWKNVQIAVGSVKSFGMMSPVAICASDDVTLQEVIRSSGFYRQKARYLRAFSSHVLGVYGGQMEEMKNRPIGKLREELLELEGVGPETADTILLYALGMPSFVVDSYSYRLLDRLGVCSTRDYDQVKAMFEAAVGRDAKRLSSAHAAIVTHCKERCRKAPVCDGCPLYAPCPSKPHDGH